MNLLQHILCVDDDLSNQEIITDFLENDYTVTCADNGLKGLAANEKQRPDLILLDIMMPVMNGIQVINHLKESVELRDIPVIIISALSYEEEIRNMYKLGAEGYITKPFTGAELKQIISQLICNPSLPPLEKED